jgi:hypothetical protein
VLVAGRKHTAISRFYYDTPFTKTQGRSHGSVAEQFKRRSHISLPDGCAFPSHQKRLPVASRVEVIMTPLQCVLEDVVTGNIQHSRLYLVQRCEACQCMRSGAGCRKRGCNQCHYAFPLAKMRFFASVRSKLDYKSKRGKQTLEGEEQRQKKGETKQKKKSEKKKKLQAIEVLRFRAPGQPRVRT